MKNSLQYAYILFVLVLCANPVFGQTEQEIKEKYGKPIQVYSVDDNIWMSATYTSDGQTIYIDLQIKKKGRPSIILPDSEPPEVVVIIWRNRKCSENNPPR